MTPNTAWLNHPFIKQAQVAIQLGVSRDLFSKKLNEVNGNQFTKEELTRLGEIRRQFLTEISQ